MYVCLCMYMFIYTILSGCSSANRTSALEPAFAKLWITPLLPRAPPLCPLQSAAPGTAQLWRRAQHHCPHTLGTTVTVISTVTIIVVSAVAPTTALLSSTSPGLVQTAANKGVVGTRSCMQMRRIGCRRRGERRPSSGTSSTVLSTTSSNNNRNNHIHPLLLPAAVKPIVKQVIVGSLRIGTC